MSVETHEEAPLDRAAMNFKFEVSDETCTFRPLSSSDPVVTAAQIAEKFGARPLTEFRILQQLPSGEIETMRPTETADLREPGRERFFVVRGDRTYDFTVDALAMEWPLSPISGSYLRILARARHEQELVRVTPHGFVPIADHDQVALDGRGIEEFRLVPRETDVTVFYREEPFKLARREWSTEELMVRFGVPAGYKLDLIEHDHEFRELKPGELLMLCEGMEFTSHVPAGQSS